MKSCQQASGAIFNSLVAKNLRLVFRLIAIPFLLICFCVSASAQTGEILSRQEIKQLERDGEFFFEKGEYDNATKYFQQLVEIKPNDPYYNLVLGICYTYNPDEREKSLDYLNKAKSLNPEFDQVELYLGRAYYKNNRFQEAIDILENILAEGNSDATTEDEALALIQYCKNAIELTTDTAKYLSIVNMGTVINTEDNEYVPLITPDESKMIFTYKGKKSTGGKLNNKGELDEEGEYHEDIFISLKSPDDWMYDEDIWLDPTGIDQLNTNLDDACIALSIDGQTLFLYKYDQDNGGDIYYSQLDGDTWGEPKPIEGSVNSKYWEGSVTISSDGQIMYFSSDRPGGMGGRDLYRAEKLEDGTWGNVQNLGPNVNTAKNDDSPFLHLDRKILYFSSEGHNSMGGYDVFYAMEDNGQWTNVTNIGAPINTTEHDMFYVSSADGKKGFYSSAYGKQSQGKQDIYYVSPDPGRVNLEPVAALIVGVVYADDVPTGSEIVVQDVTKNKPGGVFHSNSATGDYRIALLPGSKYEIEVNVENYPTHTDRIDLETLFEYIEVSNNIYIYSEKYKAENEIQASKSMNQAFENTEEAAEASVVAVPVPDEKEISGEHVEEEETATEPEVAVFGSEEQQKEDIIPEPDPVPLPDDPCDDMVDLSSMVGKDLNVVSNYNKLKTLIGEYCVNELEYRVQTGAYRFPENFKYAHLQQFGSTEVKDYPDGITRFTMGTFTTLNDADELRQNIIKAGTKDAWVVPFYDGQRLFMEDLISVNFYVRDIN